MFGDTANACLFFDPDLVFPALEQLSVRDFYVRDPSQKHKFTTGTCFPNLKTLIIQGIDCKHRRLATEQC